MTCKSEKFLRKKKVKKSEKIFVFSSPRNHIRYYGGLGSTFPILPIFSRFPNWPTSPSNFSQFADQSWDLFSPRTAAADRGLVQKEEKHA